LGGEGCRWAVRERERVMRRKGVIGLCGGEVREGGEGVLG